MSATPLYVTEITNDEYPYEKNPRLGTVIVHWSDGQEDTYKIVNESKEMELKAMYRLITPEEYHEFIVSWRNKYPMLSN